MRNLAFFFFLFFVHSGQAQWRNVSEDLRPNWMVVIDNKYVPFDHQHTQAIHLAIDENYFGRQIEFSHKQQYGIFVDGRLVKVHAGVWKMNVDSLRTLSPSFQMLSVFMPDKIQFLQMKLNYRVANEDRSSIPRSSSHFADFVILASLLLFVFFVILYRSNTSLTLDYLNITKVFLIQSREEAITTGRIGSSANLLFFGFISLCTSLMLLIIASEGYPSVTLPIPHSFPSLLWLSMWWIGISVAIFLLLITKLFLIWLMTQLFRFRDTVRFQYFNFVRSIYGSMIISGLLGAGYYIGQFQNPEFFRFLLLVICGLLTLSSAFLFLKLLSRTGSTVFHLFSYLCGSEIIPLMILIKVLLF